jgi:hypothetical protein
MIDRDVEEAFDKLSKELQSTTAMAEERRRVTRNIREEVEAHQRFLARSKTYGRDRIVYK